jgi:hypothetical protein
MPHTNRQILLTLVEVVDSRLQGRTPAMACVGTPIGSATRRWPISSGGSRADN